MDKYRKMWGVSLMAISVPSIIQGVCRLADIPMPDALGRLLGIIGLVGIPVVIYTSVKLKIWSRQD